MPALRLPSLASLSRTPAAMPGPLRLCDGAFLPLPGCEEKHVQLGRSFGASRKVHAGHVCGVEAADLRWMPL